jgi:ubiquinone/menaquinone biosynthesis C-methylase UbiE
MSRAGTGSMQTSAVSAAFDAVAETYDQRWTDSPIGRHQRDQVWRAIRDAFPTGARILELGCGTGLDAAHLALSGMRVHAMDTSAQMLRLARARIEGSGLSKSVSFERRPIEALGTLEDAGPFDGIFSNFGAINCVHDLRKLAGDSARLLRPGCKLVLCLLGRFCLWETIWFLCNVQPRKAFRRMSGLAGAATAGGAFQVHYPSIAELTQAMSGWFRLLHFRGIGILVPPSYTNEWAGRYPRIIAFAARLDHAAGKLPLLRAAGDHRLAVFCRRGSDAC